MRRSSCNLAAASRRASAYRLGARSDSTSGNNGGGGGGPAISSCRLAVIWPRGLSARSIDRNVIPIATNVARHFTSVAVARSPPRIGNIAFAGQRSPTGMKMCRPGPSGLTIEGPPLLRRSLAAVPGVKDASGAQRTAASETPPASSAQEIQRRTSIHSIKRI